jgi:hypothetical protein
LRALDVEATGDWIVAVSAHLVEPLRVSWPEILGVFGRAVIGADPVDGGAVLRFVFWMPARPSLAGGALFLSVGATTWKEGEPADAHVHGFLFRRERRVAREERSSPK